MMGSADAIGELLMVAEAQLGALAQGDLRAFGQLADRRDASLATLPFDPAGPPPAPETVSRLLELDRRALELARRLRDRAARELAEVRRGQLAVRGYGRPGTLFDLAEHFDRAG